jgi:hypothetical protein
MNIHSPNEKPARMKSSLISNRAYRNHELSARFPLPKIGLGVPVSNTQELPLDQTAGSRWADKFFSGLDFTERWVKPITIKCQIASRTCQGRLSPNISF